MCGLSGIISGSSFFEDDFSSSYNTNWSSYANNAVVPEESMFDVLMTLSSLRGTDSSGVFGVSKDKLIASCYKEVMNPISFLSMPLYDKFRTEFITSKSALIGHTRHATAGGFGLDAAHPHKVEHITLVHNGTLSDWKSLTQVDSVSDSAAIAGLFSECGGEYTKALGELLGAYALIWYDEFDGVLRIARNKERTLYYAQYKNTFLVSSELPFIRLAVERNFSVNKDTDIKYDKFDEGFLYEITPGDSSWNKEKFEIKAKPTVVYNYNNNLYTGPDKHLKDKYDIVRNKEISFVPYDYSIYNNGGSPTNKGSLYGTFLSKNGNEVKEIAITVYGVDNVEQYIDFDFITGQVRSIYHASQGGGYKNNYLPETKYGLTLEEKGLQGYVYVEDDNKVDDDKNLMIPVKDVVNEVH